MAPPRGDWVHLDGPTRHKLVNFGPIGWPRNVRACDDSVWLTICCLHSLTTHPQSITTKSWDTKYILRVYYMIT